MQDLLAVYCSLIRSILEYASIVFANLPQYLPNALENIQKSALGIIVPSMTYSQALHLTGLPSLQERRESACIRFISKISPGNLSYALISSRSQLRESPYNLTLWNVFEIHICTAVIVDFQKSPSSDFIWRAPLATSSLAVGRYAAKKGSLRLPRGQLVASQRL